MRQGVRVTTTPRLLAIDGPLTGRAFELSSAELSIGRSPGNTIVLPDAGVSRRHCTILGTGGGGFTLTDLESMHGTRVNDRPVQSFSLTHGDRIRVGQSSFVFL